MLLLLPLPLLLLLLAASSTVFYALLRLEGMFDRLPTAFLETAAKLYIVRHQNNGSQRLVKPYCTTATVEGHSQRN